MTVTIILKYFYHEITGAPETEGEKDLYSAISVCRYYPTKINKTTKLNE